MTSTPSISQKYKLGSTTYSSLAKLDTQAIKNYDLITAQSGIFYSLGLTDSSEIVVLSDSGSSTLSDQQLTWGARINCALISSDSTCYPTAIAVNTPDFVYVGAIVKNVTSNSMNSQLFLFNGSGVLQWSVNFPIGSDTATEFYEIKKIVVSNDKVILVHSFKSNSQAKDILVSVVSGSGVSQSVSTYKIGSGDTVRYSVTDAWMQTGESSILIIQSQDLTNGKELLLKVDLTAQKYYNTQFQMSSDSNFKVNSVIEKGKGQYVYGGQVKVITVNSTKSQDLSSAHGFVTKTGLTIADQCVESIETWDPNTGGSSFSSYSLSYTIQLSSSIVSRITSSLSYQTHTLGSLSQITSTSLTSLDWCKGVADFVITPPNNVSSVTYTVNSAALKEYTNSFNVSNDSGCDAYSVNYSVSTTQVLSGTFTTSNTYATYQQTSTASYLQFYTTNQNLAGESTVRVNASLSNGKNSSFDFNLITVGSCNSVVITAPVSITNFQYTVGDGEKAFYLSNFTGIDSNCLTPNYTIYSVSKISNGVTTLQGNRLNSAYSTTDILYQKDLKNILYVQTGSNSDYGIYQIKVEVENEYTKKMKENDSSYSLTFIFNLTININCILETISTNGQNLSDVTYTNVDSTQTIQLPQFTSSFDQCYITYRINYLGTIISSSSLKDIVTFTNANQKMDVFFNGGNSLFGQTYTISYAAYFSTNQAPKQDITFALTLNKCCKYASLQPSGSPTSHTYIVNSGASTKSFSAFITNDTACPISYSLHFDSTTNIISSWYTNTDSVPSSSSSNVIIWKTSSSDLNFQIQSTANTDQRNTFTENGPIILRVKGQNDNLIVTESINLTILPDCSLMQITASSLSDIEYTIYSSQVNQTFSDFTSNEKYCESLGFTYTLSVSENGSTIPSSSYTSLINLVSKSIQIYNTQNIWGDRTFTATVTGVSKFAGASATASFSVQIKTIKDCSRVDISPMVWGVSGSTSPDKVYANADQELVISYSKPTQMSNGYQDSSCDLIFSLNFATKDNPSFQSYSQAPFITSFSNSGSTHSITIHANDDSTSNVNNFTLQMVTQVSTAQKGIKSMTMTLWLEVRSLCTLVQWTPTTSISDYYYIKQPQKTVTIPKFQYKWPISKTIQFTQDQLKTKCGDITYNLYKNTGNLATYETNPADASIFTLDSSGSDLLIQIKSEDPMKAGGAKYSVSTTYNLVILGQLGNYYLSRNYQYTTVTLKDQCWQATVSQDPNATSISDQSVLRNKQLIYTFNNFKDLVALGRVVDQTLPSGYTCMPLKYTALLYQFNAASKNEYLRETSNSIQFHENNRTFFVYETDRTKEGTYYIQLEASHEYSNYPILQVKFKIQIGNCVVDNIYKPNPYNISYPIKGGNKTFSLNKDSFKFTPDCDYNFTFSAQISNGTALPQWITFDSELQRYMFNIKTDNISLLDETFDLQLVANIKDLVKNQVLNTTKINFPLKFTLFIPPILPPSYSQPPTNQTIYFDQSLNYSTGLPSNISSVEVLIKNESLKEIMTLQKDADKLNLTFKIRPTGKQYIGTYDIQMVLSDAPNKLVKTYYWQIKVQDYFNYNSTQSQSTQKIANTNSIFKPPILTLEDFSSQGILTLESDEPLIVPFNITSLSTNEVLKIFKISVIPGEDQDVKMVGLKNVTIIEYSPEQIKIKFIFENPLYISSGSTPDRMSITIRDPGKFTSETKKINVDPSKSVFYFKLPAMLPSDLNQDAFLNAAKSLDQSMKSAVLGNLVVNIVMQGSLHSMWGMINTLQVTLHLSTINMQIPANIQYFNSILVGITQFDVLPAEYLQYFYVWKLIEDSQNEQNNELSEQTPNKTEKVTSQNESEEQSNQTKGRNLNEQVEEDSFSSLQDAGYGSKNIIYNLGTTFIFQMFILIKLILLCLLKFLSCICKSRWLERQYKALKLKIFWNGLIRFLIEIYLELTISCLINIVSLEDMEGGISSHYIALGYTFIVSVLIFVVPFFMIYFILKNIETIIDEDDFERIEYSKELPMLRRQLDDLLPFRQRYGNLYDKLKPLKWNLMMIPAFLLRRLLMGLTVVILREYPGIQVIILVTVSLFQVIYLGKVQPYQMRKQNKVELFNECINMVIIYTYICYSDFMHDVQMRFDIGWLGIFLTVFIILVNMLIIIHGFITLLIKRCLFKCFKQPKKEIGLLKIPKIKQGRRITLDPHRMFRREVQTDQQENEFKDSIEEIERANQAQLERMMKEATQIGQKTMQSAIPRKQDYIKDIKLKIDDQKTNNDQDDPFTFRTQLENLRITPQQNFERNVSRMIERQDQQSITFISRDQSGFIEAKTKDNFVERRVGIM